MPELIDTNLAIVLCFIFFLIGCILGFALIFRMLPDRTNSLRITANYYPDGIMINEEKVFIRGEAELVINCEHVIWQKILIKEENFIKAFCKLDLWIAEQKANADRFILHNMVKDE